MGFLCVWDQILVVLVTKIFLVAWKTECWTKLFSDNHMLLCCFFLLFFQHVSLTLFHLCPRRFYQSTFSADPCWYYKELCFRKDMYSLSPASFQLEHPLRMQASSRFWLPGGHSMRSWLHRNNCRTTTADTSLLRLLKSSERWGNRKVLGWIGTGGTRISVTECIVITQAHDAHICKVKTFETNFVARHVN